MADNEYVVDVFVPIAVAVIADDAEQAEAMALDALVEQGVKAKFDALIDEDFDNSFVISDTEPRAEAGEA